MAAELIMSNHNMNALQPGSPMSGMRGSVWSKRVAGSGLAPESQEFFSSSGRSLGVSSSEANLRTGETWQRLPSTASGTRSSMLPTVASAPGLQVTGGRRAPQRRQQSSAGIVSDAPQRRRFASGTLGLRGSDVLTPRTLAAAEIRLNAYLESREETEGDPDGRATSGSASKAHDSKRSDAAAVGKDGAAASDAQEESLPLENPALREFWEISAAPLPFAPTPTAIDEKLQPLDAASAVEVLRNTSACASLEDQDLHRILSIGARRFFPRYSVAMREGAVARGVMIILQGKIQLQPSILERQALKRGRASESGAGEQKALENMGIIGPSQFCGELSLVLTIPRLQSAVFLEDTELLLIDAAQLKQLPLKPAEAFTNDLKASFVSKSLKMVPFFMTLPELTHRQIAGLFEVENFRKGEVICRQGDPGDRMYIVLFGHVEVWRQKKRGAPRDMIAEYTGLSPYPWFGELMQWVNDHGRAGDVVVTEDTLTLMLHRDRVQEFVLLVPGFKALSMSAASAFTIKSVKARGARGEEEAGVVTRSYEAPLKYAMQWTRIVSRLIGIENMDRIALVKMQEIRQKNVNSMHWVKDMIASEAKFGAVELDPAVLDAQEAAQQQRFDAQRVFEEQRRKLLVMAHQKNFGDTKTLAETATVGKLWRSDWGVHWSVRTELLRRPQFEFELKEAREKLTYHRERPPESFPVQPVL